MPDSHWKTVVLSAALLALAIVLRIYLPRFPVALSLVVLGWLLSVSLDLKAHGVATVGHVPRGLPSVQLPPIHLADVRRLVLPAIGLALVGFGDATANGRVFARRRGYELDANQELAGLAGAQIASAFTGGMPVSSSDSAPRSRMPPAAGHASSRSRPPGSSRSSPRSRCR